MYSSRKNLQGLFFAEATEYHLQVQEILTSFSASGGLLSKEDSRELHRLFHNIKGAAAQVDLPSLSETAWTVEVVLEDIAYHHAPFTEECARVLNRLSSAIYEYCKVGRYDEDKEQSLLQETRDVFVAFLKVKSVLDWPNATKLLSCELEEQEHHPKFDETERLIQLLHKYSVLVLQEKINFDEAMLEEFQQGIATLRDYALHAQQEQKERLLYQFNQFLDSFRNESPSVYSDLPPLINQLFEFLLIVESADTDISSCSFSKIIEKISKVSERDVPHVADDISQLLDNNESEFLTSTVTEETAFAEAADLFSEEDDFYVDDIFTAEDSPVSINGSEPFIEKEDLPEGLIEDFDGDEEEYSLEEIFYAECEEHIATINMSMLVIEQGGENEETTRKALAEIRRATHTLKGAAAMTGFNDLSAFSHLSEDFLDELYEGGITLDNDIVALLSEIVSVVEALAYRSENVLQTQIDSIQTAIGGQLSLLKGARPLEPFEHKDKTEFIKGEETESAISGPTDNVLVQLEKIDELQVLGGDIVTTRNAMVGFLDDLNQTLNELEIAKDKLRKISNELDEGFEVQALHGFGAATGSQSLSEESEFDVMELDRYSELSLIIRSLNETSVDLGSVHSGLLQASGNIRGQLSRQELTTRVTQNRLMRIRMTPLSSVSRVFFQTVRSTAKDLGKKVQLHIDGEDIYLDRFIWKKISDPIMHILRNSIDHGIESIEHRVLADKAEQGSITIQTIQRGNAVVLRIHDDGAGIDLKKLNDTLIRKEILAEDHGLSDQQLLQYLFHAGITTKDEVSMVSGRGVGLDVVYKNIHELKGSVLIHSEQGVGTTFEINVPISLSINKGIIISDNGRLFAIPLQDIEEIIAYIPPTSDQENVVAWRGESVEKVDLYDLVGSGEREARAEKQLAVIVAWEGQYKALVIDSVTKQQEIVVKNLGSHLRKVVGVSGVTDLGDGTLIPILDIVELCAHKQEKIVPFKIEKTTAVKDAALHVLVVDDSISVRQSVMRLLKGQGCVVSLAKDGVEALEKLQGITVDVIVSDIEMPRMNGYEFKESLNNTEHLQKVPVLMLTSRVSPKHKQKAHDLGIQGFVTKPYRDEDFVSLVRQLASQSREGR